MQVHRAAGMAAHSPGHIIGGFFKVKLFEQLYYARLSAAFLFLAFLLHLIFSPIQDVCLFSSFFLFSYYCLVICLNLFLSFQPLSQSAVLIESVDYFEFNKVNISSLDLVSSEGWQCLLGCAIRELA